jgi:hypothetical protein
LDCLPPELRAGYARDFHLADTAFQAGRVEATSKNRETRWQNWCSCVKQLGVDPYLDGTPFQTRVRCLTGFAQRVQAGFFGHGRQVQSSTVSQAITAIGQTIKMARNVNPTKIMGSDKFLPVVQVVLDGYGKTDPPTNKKLPVESDVPELLVDLGYGKGGTPHSWAIGDLALIPFYSLLCIGEYTIKSKRNNTKQTVQFKLEDVRFFKWNNAGVLTCLPKNAPSSLLLTADSATLKLDNQKNGLKGVCVHQEANGEEFKCPVRALARRVIHLREHNVNGKTFLSTFFQNSARYDVCGEDISRGLKLAASILQYPVT